MIYQIRPELFNPKPPTLLFIDLNSCFATIEQQANRFLRGKPIAVAAYETPGGCIVAPSIEAKTFGIKTGMRVKDGKMLCPGLIVVTPDPYKYRFVNEKLDHLLKDYTNLVEPKSIDEFVLDLEGAPAYKKGVVNVAKEIKQRIKREVGDWMTVSIGVGTNRVLSKMASGLQKPDGLVEINKDNYLDIFSKYKLDDIPGIATANTIRLNKQGIFTILDFYNATQQQLKAAFESKVNAYKWYQRIRGWELDDVIFGRHSFSNNYALAKPTSNPEDLAPILCKLAEKVGFRLRSSGYRTKGIGLFVIYNNEGYWHHNVSIKEALFDSRDIYDFAYRMLLAAPYKERVSNLSIFCFNLVQQKDTQLGLFEDFNKKEKLVEAQDKINKKFGKYTISPALMTSLGEEVVMDRVSFGNIKEIEEFIQGD